MKFNNIILTGTAASIATAYVSPLRRHYVRSESQQTNPAPIISTLNGYWFDVEVQFGNQSFYLVVDTGSSDTWVAKTGYHCIGENNTEVSEDECGWLPTFDEPEGFEYVKNQTFGVQYGTGIATGKVGIENVTIGGITVPRQKVGIVDSTNDLADGINGGILGLGYPALTSAHYGTNNSNSSEGLLTNRAVYDPVFFNMFKNNLVEPWFSVALERPKKNSKTNPGGWLGLGELPSVSYSSDWAVADIEITKSIPDFYYEDGKPVISLMTLTVDSVSWGKATASKASLKSNSTAFQAVVDTGNPANQLPSELAAEINAAFEPPAQYSEDLGVYIVQCNASAPQLGVTIDNHTFYHEAVDLIQQDASTGLCYSQVSAGASSDGISLNFLGDAFLRNVVAVFDLEKDQMRFAARTEESANEPTPSTTTSGATSLGGKGSWKLIVVLGLAIQLLALL